MTRWKLPLETPRLWLRDWRDEDEATFEELNSEPKLWEFYPAIPTLAETRESIVRMRTHFAEKGYGLFLMESKTNGELLGICGVFHPAFEAPYTPCYEIGWRVKPTAWNQGLATEAARETVRFASEDLEAPEVVAVTAPVNLRSRRVMEKLGMTHDPNEDFLHPRVPEGHPLQKHVLYRLRPVVASAAKQSR